MEVYSPHAGDLASRGSGLSADVLHDFCVLLRFIAVPSLVPCGTCTRLVP
jgi:hypothetical protein